MNDSLISLRNRINGLLYKNIVKNICFKTDAEKVHTFFIKVGKMLGNSNLARNLARSAFYYDNNMLEQNILGIHFKSPIGLSAGFDKNAELLRIIPQLSFGFEEAGSVTARPCRGNPGKRIERIPDKKSLWINLGLNNNGTVEIYNRLKNQKFDIPFGISIAKTNCKETVDPEIAVKDYLFSIKTFNNYQIGDYYVLNISCPNAFGGQPFSDSKLYELLLKRVSLLKIKKPIFVKISPDLNNKNIDKIISLSLKYKISGFVCSNLTKKDAAKTKSGGLSGKSVEALSNSLISHVYKKSRGKLIIIGVGGIFSAEDAYKKIKLGASLVELITGMIYEGPNLISDINLGLVRLLKRDGYNNIRDAIGAESR